VDLLWWLGGAVVSGGAAALAIRVPRARRWLAAAVVVALGAITSGIFLLGAVLQNIDTDGSLEEGPLAGGVATAIVTVVLAVAIVRLWPRRVSRP
jgi:peptidoglycan/LPS O-acetylase OafA/YrhL